MAETVVKEIVLDDGTVIRVVVDRPDGDGELRLGPWELYQAVRDRYPGCLVVEDPCVRLRHVPCPLDGVADALVIRPRRNGGGRTAVFFWTGARHGLDVDVTVRAWRRVVDRVEFLVPERALDVAPTGVEGVGMAWVHRDLSSTTVVGAVRRRLRLPLSPWARAQVLRARWERRREQ